jgi:membrane protease YdiL (CAAX protease family)
LRRAVRGYLKTGWANTNPPTKEVPVAAFWSEAALMTTSGLCVAAVAIPVGLVARALRPPGEPLLPRWKPWPVPWTGFEVTIAFVIVSFLLPVVALQVLTDTGFYLAVYGPDLPARGAKGVTDEQLKVANTVRAVWANMFALPFQIGMLWITARTLYPKWKPAFVGRGSIAGKVSLAVLAWLVLTPAVLALNTIVAEVSKQFDVTPEQHVLTVFGQRPLLDQVVFVLEACVGAPLREEVIFRGVILAWCVGRIRLPGAGVSPMTGARPWFVMAATVAVTVLAHQGRTAPLVFAGLLVLGLGAVWWFTRTGARRARAVYATAALFALGHPDWPSPIPLFALGLGLGWLALRTNGVLVPVIVHGLFNAVSAVFVLRAP